MVILNVLIKPLKTQRFFAFSDEEKSPAPQTYPKNTTFTAFLGKNHQFSDGKSSAPLGF